MLEVWKQLKHVKDLQIRGMLFQSDGALYFNYFKKSGNKEKGILHISKWI